MTPELQKTRIALRPTLRAVLLFAASIPVAFIILAFDPAKWIFAFNFAVLVLVALMIDAAICLPAKRLQITVDVPLRIFIGQSVDLIVRLVQPGKALNQPFAVIIEQRGEAEPPRIAYSVTSSPTDTMISLPIHPLQRGRIDIDAIWLRWTGPLGLVERTWRHPVCAVIDVVPDVQGIQGKALQFSSRDAIDGIKVQRQKGEGAEFESLREHTAGLDNRYIDWKRSAKHRKLLSKEFRSERNHHIILAFDTGHLMRERIGDLARLDHAIHAGLLLAWVSLRAGDHVGSFGFDASIRQFIQPSRGLPWFVKLQRGTSQLGYHMEETNFTLGLAELNARLKRRALVIIFTEFVDTVTAELLIESLQRMANRHAVVFVTLRDPALESIIDAVPDQFQAIAQSVVAHDLMRERAIVLERLERIGVHCLDVPVNSLPVALINRYLAIKDKGLI